MASAASANKGSLIGAFSLPMDGLLVDESVNVTSIEAQSFVEGIEDIIK